MIPWWRVWEGIVGEYWDGPWRLIVDDLGGDVGIALTVPVEDHLIIGLDRAVLSILAEDDRLGDVGGGLRRLLENTEDLNSAGVYAGIPLSPMLRHMRKAWMSGTYIKSHATTAQRSVSHDRFKKLG
ncbi:hypothetical protein [Sulfobacillus harzensis]|uniref:Uncharacterized protein n=1 Tax=Sulfobacillus harzensis TaxID=2729629 RepID=A0A7Y0L667_9FIRM|nr:hypothetical protein [Sulfobacillus harzensis]NMP23677.1 hypothetical protein [Sulfobacillus harzensis]